MTYIGAMPTAQTLLSVLSHPAGTLLKPRKNVAQTLLSVLLHPAGALLKPRNTR